jgi:lysozyme
MRPIPEAAITLVKHFEGCSLTAYKDGGGVLTIGYGHTGSDVKLGQKITQQQANSLLFKDLSRAAQAVLRLTKVSLTDNQYAALISFVFNVGAGAYQRSTLRQRINRKEMGDIRTQFLRWCKDNGITIPGLLRRREAESRLFLC